MKLRIETDTGMVVLRIAQHKAEGKRVTWAVAKIANCDPAREWLQMFLADFDIPHNPGWGGGQYWMVEVSLPAVMAALAKMLAGEKELTPLPLPTPEVQAAVAEEEKLSLLEAAISE